MQKYLQCDYEEYKKIAKAFFTISTLLSSILTNPIEISKLIIGRINSDDYKPNIKRMLFALINFNNFFIDECHQTFLSCTHAFYPTNTLKWGALCDFLTNNASQSEFCDRNSFASSDCMENLFTNSQLYLLSAIIKAYCNPSLKLISFFPTFKGSIIESYEDYSAINETASPNSGDIVVFCLAD